MGTLGRRMECNTETVGLVVYSVHTDRCHMLRSSFVRTWVQLGYYLVTKELYTLVRRTCTKSWNVTYCVLMHFPLGYMLTKYCHHKVKVCGCLELLSQTTWPLSAERVCPVVSKYWKSSVELKLRHRN